METKSDFPKHVQLLRTNLQNTKWVILLGAGASVSAGLPTMNNLTEKVLDVLKDTHTISYRLINEIHSLLKEEKKDDKEDEPSITIEEILEVLYGIRALKLERERFCISLKPLRNISCDRVDECIKRIKQICVEECNKNSVDLTSHIAFLDFWLSGVSETNIFTTNWDSLVEQACDYLNRTSINNIYCIDGFKGHYTRIFSPNIYEEKISTIRGRNLKRINYYKLHGGINWRKYKESIICGYREYLPEEAEEVIIYPTPLKYKEVLSSPYMELMRRFANALENSDYLLAIGTSFPDEHINNIIRDALKKSSFNLFTVNPSLDEKCVRDKFGDSSKVNKPINLCFSCLTRCLKGGEPYETFMDRKCDICNGK